MDRHTTRRRGRALAALGLAALLLAGCGAADRSNSSGDSAAEAPAGGAPAGGAAEQGKAGAGAPDLRVDQRSIIYTGTMRVQVDDVEGAARRAVAAVVAAGGFVGGDNRRSVAADAEAELELRVPAAKFTALIDELATYGRQQRREVKTQDVTEETVDLDARIATQRARVDSARKLLSRATSIPELVSLEDEVSRREADLASLEAKKRRLADLTALSTITVTFVGMDASTAEEETETGFMVGLRGGWKVFVASMTILLTVLGAVLPWLLAFGVPLVVFLAVLRRRRRGRPAPPAPPTMPVGTPRPPAPTAPPPVPAARSGP
ncbi:protein of unknown function [Micromonospora purpureochromogenes]|uniref:DUF4349 domain-containing protein n=1 Tax=Micromonospora purpureochromogenes TaxID=47872 RepID=A0A1C5AE82_9ACTN|nr:DUF4349 domain-containing protein [Micromonospora purpureochromogenes]SCF43535.1 protein of unknown function [Micromonospora purpureochromogenes]